MDQINILMSTQLTERELIIYLLVEAELISDRALAKALGITHTTIADTHRRAGKKIDRLAPSLFSTEVKEIK
jgi:DNA-binding CsgD family transcriptional regulator